MVVKYENYKRFGADTSVSYGDVVADPRIDRPRGSPC